MTRAIEEGSPFSAGLLVDPMLEDLRADPRFDPLAAQVKLKASS